MKEYESAIDKQLIEMVDKMKSVINDAVDIVSEFVKDYPIDVEAYHKDVIYHRTVNESLKAYAKGYMRCLDNLKSLASK